MARCGPLIRADPSPHRWWWWWRGDPGPGCSFSRMRFKSGFKACGTSVSTAGSPVGRASPGNRAVAERWSSFPAPAPPQPSLPQAPAGKAGWAGGAPGTGVSCQPAWPCYTEFGLRAFQCGAVISTLSSRKNFLLTVASSLTCAAQNGHL